MSFIGENAKIAFKMHSLECCSNDCGKCAVWLCTMKSYFDVDWDFPNGKFNWHRHINHMRIWLKNWPISSPLSLSWSDTHGTDKRDQINRFLSAFELRLSLWTITIRKLHFRNLHSEYAIFILILLWVT